MAAKACKDTQQQSLAEGVDKELTCAICLCRYDHPKVLPCLHSYCKGCLEKLAKKTHPQQQIACPQCKEVHEIPPLGIDAFKTYFTINNLIELLRVHEATTPKESTNSASVTIFCESGVDENPAVAHCLMCSDHLCESCFALHKKLKLTRDHNVVMLKDLQQMDRKTGVKSVRPKLYCDEHKDELLKLFCKTCEKVICRDCVLVKHRQHEYVFVHESRHEVQNQLEVLVKKAEKKQAEFKVHSERVVMVRKSSSAAFSTSKKEASAFFDKMVQSIEARRRKVLSDLDTLIQTEEKKLNAETDYLEIALARLSNSIQFTRKILDNEDDVEMMVMSTQAKPALEKLQQLTWDQKKVQIKPPKVFFDLKDLQKCESMGIILNLKVDDIVISQLPAKVRGHLSFDVLLSQEISQKSGADFTPLLSVKITHSRDGSEQPVKIKKKGQNKWNVVCEPNRYGQLNVTIKIDDIVKEHQVEIQPRSLAVGMKVVRGPNWKYGGQDGSSGEIGTVEAVDDSVSHPIFVRWPSGRSNWYRWSIYAYDLNVVS